MNTANTTAEAETPVLLKQASISQLLDELVSRGHVISAWSREDLDFLDETDWTAELTDEQLEALKDLVLVQAGAGLKDILGARGNEHLADWADLNKDRLIEEVTKVPPVSDEQLKDVIDDVLDRAKTYEFTVGKGNARELILESSSLLDVEMPAEQVEEAVRRLFETKEKYEQVAAVDSPQNRFDYQLLGRLQQDCEYYLGNGNRAAKHLWAGNEAEQIAKMKELYNRLPIKPEWLTLEKIEQYEAAMIVKP